MQLEEKSRGVEKRKKKKEKQNSSTRKKLKANEWRGGEARKLGKKKKREKKVAIFEKQWGVDSRAFFRG